MLIEMMISHVTAVTVATQQLLYSTVCELDAAVALDIVGPSWVAVSAVTV